MKKLRTSHPKKPKRNPHARALRTALFRPKVVKKEGVYRRRAKHPHPLQGDDAGEP